jgi:putative membrane-bound dehydrogenase-like protein
MKRFSLWAAFLSLELSCAFLIGVANAAETPLALKPASGLKPFEYMPSAADLPNYRANAQWGTQDEPIRTMQKPLAPEESQKHLVTQPEFAVSLFASEPEIVKAIWLSWDERGRLWIASTTDYPNNMQPDGEGHDRLIICEDTNGDGKADKFTTFADKLSVPTSFVFANGGVIVVHSGKAEFLRDTNGDDKADERRDLFRGFGTKDTHAGPSNLRSGFDNWIWGTVGYSGFDGTVGGKQVRFGQGIYRFKPDGSALEFIRSSNNNTWGLGFTEDNIVIGSTANGNASIYMPIANRYYEAVNGFSASVLGTIADSQQFFPITDKVRQVDWHGKFTAGAGSTIYTARSFPKDYWNRAQFVNEPTGHLLARFNLERKGADFLAVNEHNFAASDDEWTSPVCAEVGPDGALWVSDWYNYIIQHNPTPRGFKNGKGNAYETPLRDTAHGRIYRIAYKQGPKPSLLSLNRNDATELVAALKSDNLFWRMTAQRMLIERGQRDVVSALAQLAGDAAVDEVGLNAGAIHALWTLQGLGALDGKDAKALAAQRAALKHRSAGVRRAAIMTGPRTEESLKAILDGKLLNDPDAQVRMAALLAVSEMPASNHAAMAVFAMLQKPGNSGDRWIPDAAVTAAARNDAAFLRQVLTSDKAAAGGGLPGEVGRVVRMVTSHYAQRAPVDTILATLSALNGAAPELSVPILDGLVAGWPANKPPSLSAEDKRRLVKLMDALTESVRDRLLALSQRWNQPDLFGAKFAGIVESLKREVTDTSAADEKRIAAAKRLIGIDSRNEVGEFVLQQVSTLTAPALANGYVNALGESRSAETSRAILGAWDRYTPVVRRSAVAVLMRRSEWARELLDAVEKSKIPRGDLAADQWSQLKSNPNPTISRRAERLMQTGNAVSADREEIVKKLLPVAKEKGDPARGKEVFTATCAVCHTFNGQGGKVGPDLSGIGAKPRAEILTDILDPNRSVEANYRLWNVTTKDGETLSGRLDAETQTTVEILDTTGQKHVTQRKDIASMQGLTTSIMPTGFEALPSEDLKSLLEYLCAAHP